MRHFLPDTWLEVRKSEDSLDQTRSRLPKILIIDDEPDIRVYLSAVLEDNGYDSVFTEPARPVSDILLGEKPDLIVLDIMMPMKSGISIYREIRLSENFRKIPVIIISGMSGADDFMKTGFRKMICDDTIPLPEGFIEKPVDIDLLVKRISQLL